MIDDAIPEYERAWREEIAKKREEVKAKKREYMQRYNASKKKTRG